MCTSSVIDKAFFVWVRRGVATINDLFIDNTFTSIDQLRLKLNIPHSHFFRFLQLCSFLSASSIHFPPQPPSSLLDSILKLNPCSKGNIGILYFLVNSQGTPDYAKESLGGRLEDTVC